MNDALKKLVDELGNDCKCVMCKHKNTIRDALRVAVEGLEWVKENGRYDSATHARTTLTELSRILGVEGEKFE